MVYESPSSTSRSLSTKEMVARQPSSWEERTKRGEAAVLEENSYTLIDFFVKKCYRLTTAPLATVPR